MGLSGILLRNKAMPSQDLEVLSDDEQVATAKAVSEPPLTSKSPGVPEIPKVDKTKIVEDVPAPKAAVVKAKASPKSPTTKSKAAKAKAKATPKSQTAAKSTSKKPAMKRPAACEAPDTGDVVAEAEPQSSSTGPPPKKFKATKYLYHKDKKWGCKVNGKEMCTVGVWPNIASLFQMNFHLRRSLQVWFQTHCIPEDIFFALRSSMILLLDQNYTWKLPWGPQSF